MTIPLLVCILAADHLGTITPRRAISISSVINREDFAYFVVEVIPRNPPTNVVTLTVTNGLLTADLMEKVPDGRGVLGVRSVFNDGIESEVSLYTYDLRREPPPKPVLTPVGVSSAPEESKSLTGALRRITRRLIPPPPLPGGTNAAYSQRVELTADPRKRRNE